MAIIPSTLNTGLSSDQIMEAFDNALTHVPGTSEPAMDGTGSAGSADTFSRSDHVHPTDTSRASAAAEAEDRAALVELVDSGAKNFINVGFTSKAATATSPSLINNNDGSITLNGSNTGNNSIIVRDICSDLAASQDTRYTLPTGVYELCGTGNEDVVLQVYMHDGTSANLTQLAQASISSVVEFAYTSNLKATYPYICFRLYIKAPTASHEVSFNNLLIEPMICTKAAWGISHAYQPHRPSEDEQNTQIAQNTSDIATRTGFGTAIPQNADLNDYTTIGEYYCATASIAASLANLPLLAKPANGHLTVKGLNSNSNVRLTQIWHCNFATANTKGIILIRDLGTNDVWTNWFAFNGTEIIPST